MRIPPTSGLRRWRIHALRCLLKRLAEYEEERVLVSIAIVE
jgi:hypothetical protein